MDGSCASIDNGVTWTGTNSGFCALSMGKNSAGLFAGSENAIYFSTNNGSSWTNVYTTGNNNITWGFAFLHDTVFAATFSSGIITSPDNGVTWYSSNMGLPNDTLLTVFSKDNILYAGTYGHGIYISIDAGNSWFPSYIGIPSGTYIKDFATDGVNIYATSYGTIYISNNGGTSWYAAPLIVGPTFTIAKIACISNAILAGGYTPAGAEGMYRSLDSGATWALFNMGLPTGCPYGIGAIYPTSAYAFCGMESNGCGTVFRIPISEVISSVKSTAIPKDSYEIYPNPSTDFITIKWNFNLSLNQKRNIYIIDIAGKEIFHQSIIGNETKINTDFLEEGIYLLQFLSDEQLTETKKLVVVRN